MPLTVPPIQNAIPSDHNFLGWTFDPVEIQASTILPTAGLLNLARMRIYGTLVTNVAFHITTPGATLTAGQCFAGLFNAAGTLLAATADQAANWQSGGLKVMALSSPQAWSYGAYGYVGWYSNGTTQPTLSRALNSSSAILNAGLSAPNFRYASADSGLTTAMPATFGAQTGTATAYFAAAS